MEKEDVENYLKQLENFEKPDINFIKDCYSDFSFNDTK